MLDTHAIETAISNQNVPLLEEARKIFKDFTIPQEVRFMAGLVLYSNNEILIEEINNILRAIKTGPSSKLTRPQGSIYVTPKEDSLGQISNIDPAIQSFVLNFYNTFLSHDLEIVENTIDNSPEFQSFRLWLGQMKNEVQAVKERFISNIEAKRLALTRLGMSSPPSPTDDMSLYTQYKQMLYRYQSVTYSVNNNLISDTKVLDTMKNKLKYLIESLSNNFLRQIIMLEIPFVGVSWYVSDVVNKDLYTISSSKKRILDEIMSVLPLIKIT